VDKKVSQANWYWPDSGFWLASTCACTGTCPHGHGLYRPTCSLVSRTIPQIGTFALIMLNWWCAISACTPQRD